MYVVGGSASQKLAGELAKVLKAKLAKVEIKRFPDDECYVRIDEDLDGEEVFLVQTTWPDKNIVELFLLQDAIREFEVSSLATVVPYFGYARQDKQFKPGEPISARALARLIQEQTDAFITVDIHAPSVIDWFSEVSAHNAHAYPEIGKFLKKKGVQMVLSPDEGRWDNARRIADVMNCEADFLVKERLDGETVTMTPKSLEVKGKNVEDVTVGGAPIDPAKTYSVTVTDFMYSGGDGYKTFTGKPSTSTGLPLRELLVDTIRKQGKIEAIVEGRILRE